mgnify:CR=1 FL=1
MGNKKGLLKSILPWLIVLMVISVAIPFFNQSESSEIRYDKFIEIVQKEKVKDVEIVPKSLVMEHILKKQAMVKKKILNSLLLFQEQKQN